MIVDATRQVAAGSRNFPAYRSVEKADAAAQASGFVPVAPRSLVPIAPAPPPVPASSARSVGDGIRVEDEERVIADGLEVAVVGGLLLPTVDGTLRAVDIEDHAPGRRSRRRALNQFRIQVGESLIVPLLREDVCFEPMQRRREGDARLSALARGHHPKRRVLGQPLGVVGILVTGQPAVDRLAEEVRQRKLAVVPGAGIGEVPFDEAAQAELLVQLAREQQPGIGGHRDAPELDAKLGIE